MLYQLYVFYFKLENRRQGAKKYMNSSHISLAVLFLHAFVIGGCSSQTATEPSSTNTANTDNPPIAQPRHGGILRRVTNSFPKVLGYPPEFSPIDSGFAGFALERLVVWDENGNIVPELAESWEGDPENRILTWHLRKGVKFTDGTDFNAEALKRNYEMQMRAGRLSGSKSPVSMEIIDDHTLKIQVNDYNRMVLMDYGFFLMISPTAFEKAGNGDIERSKEWARFNAVGTGPFKVVDFQRDVVIRHERNNNYWRENRPYLAGIESRLIPDIMISSAMMQAKEADILTAADVQTALDLQEMGFKINWGLGLLMTILPNSADPDSIFADKKVREALEYAIDRPALAKMIGYGKYQPSTQIAGSTFMGYIPEYSPRPYNLNKAKQLLAEAGYPNGFETELIAVERDRDVAAAIQGYLSRAGIKVDVDIADSARYVAAVFKDGWSDLALAASGVNPDATEVFVHFGPTATTFSTTNIFKSPEYIALCNEALHTYDDAKYKELLQKILIQASKDAMVVPLYTTVGATVMQPFVHSSYLRIHGQIWQSYKDWMEAP
jgi:ABC-type transport system substrate-binding protein